ncbi:MAG: hypothetical protein B7Z57_13865 [Acidiphilium sp. 37-60-79]|nr:MAG: hypothetical protein B7Z57_13865 [Acidiphilium sp. 37-60-79]OZB38725.1 MAG: hypothetical protein B7X48_11995 [Acidiphilium sp. 34-60-192]
MGFTPSFFVKISIRFSKKCSKNNNQYELKKKFFSFREEYRIYIYENVAQRSSIKRYLRFVFFA